MGNKAAAGGRYRIGHSVMKDALDIDGIYAAIRNAGLDLPERPRSEDLKGRLVNCFIKSEADHRAKLRGRRQIMLDDLTSTITVIPKAAVGEGGGRDRRSRGLRLGRRDAGQGPHGGGPVIAIVDVGD
jgi:cyanuric acid amidohydrolase